MSKAQESGSAHLLGNILFVPLELKA